MSMSNLNFTGGVKSAILRTKCLFAKDLHLHKCIISQTAIIIIQVYKNCLIKHSVLYRTTHNLLTLMSLVSEYIFT